MKNLGTVMRRLCAAFEESRTVEDRYIQSAAQDPTGQGAASFAVMARAIVDENGNRFFSHQIVVTGITHTITEDDCGAVLVFTSDTDVTVTVSADLPKKFSCGCTPDGLGKLNFVAASGATLRSSGGAVASSGQYGYVTVYVKENTTGSTADVRLYGSLA